MHKSWAAKSLQGALCLAAFWTASAASGQSPIGGEFRVNTFTRRFQTEPAVAFASDGSFLAAWHSYLLPQPGDEYGRSGVLVRSYDAAGRPRSEPFVISEYHGENTPLVVAAPGGGYLVAWNEIDGLSALARLVSEEGAPVGPRSLVGGAPATQQGIGGACAIPDGGFAALRLSTELATQTQDLLLGVLDASGSRAGSDVAIAQGHVEANDLWAGEVVAQGTGELLTVWGQVGADGSGDSVVGQMLDRGFNPIGASFIINTFTEGHQGGASAAAIGAGEFVVVWQSENQDGSLDGIYAQRVSMTEGKIGPEFRVNTGTFSAQRSPSVAADPQGNFVVVWLSYAGFYWDVKGQLFRRDGSPVGGEFRLNTQVSYPYSRPRVAFGPNGTFAAVWESWSDGDWDIAARRFAASPGDEVCLVRSGIWRCDSGRTGGEAEVVSSFSRRGGDPLLGDVDGDGREDPCAYFNGNLRCDLDHLGEGAEWSRHYGPVGSRLVLVDVNGDGRADPCLRDGNRFLCDTAHDGGGAEATLAFGLATDEVVVGDVDGDGRDDLCVVRGDGVFRCDTAHDGGRAETRIAFGQPGDVSLIGDYDGDGKDDPCVLRSSQLLCDAAHDGGAAEGELTISATSGALPLLGNLDGL